MGEIPASRDSDGHLMLTVVLDGKPVQVILDFERPFSLISRAKASQLGASIGRGHGGVLSMGEDFHGDAATLGILRLGKAELKDFEAAVDDGRKAYDGIILGYNMLRYFVPEFDLAHDVIRLFGKDHCPDKLVYWSPDYLKFGFDDHTALIMIAAKLDGRDVNATLAPERLRSTISFDAADHLSLAHEGEGMLQSLEFGGIALHHVAVDVTDLRYPNDPSSVAGHLSRRALMKPTDLKIGADVLKHMRFMIDFEAKTIYFTVG